MVNGVKGVSKVNPCYNEDPQVSFSVLYIPEERLGLSVRTPFPLKPLLCWPEQLEFFRNGREPEVDGICKKLVAFVQQDDGPPVDWVFWGPFL